MRGFDLPQHQMPPFMHGQPPTQIPQYGYPPMQYIAGPIGGGFPPAPGPFMQDNRIRQIPMHAQPPMHNPLPMHNVYSAMPPAISAMQQPTRESSPLSAIFKAFQNRTSPPPSKGSTPPPSSRGLSPARTIDQSALARVGNVSGPKVKTFNPKMFEPEELRRFVTIFSWR